MRIGQLAKAAGVHPQTLRFYEREGLLPKALRTHSGYRDYAKSDLERVRFVRACQEIGFTLADIRNVLDLHRVLATREGVSALKPGAQRKFLDATERRLAAVEGKLKLLRRMKNDLRGLAATLRDERKPVCPVTRQRVT